MRKEKLTFISIGIVVGIVIGIVALSSIPAVVKTVVPTEKSFDATIWKNDRLREERFAMWQDLVSKHDLFGMSRRDLIALLGPADGETSDELSWNMGSEQQQGLLSTTKQKTLRIKLTDERVAGWGLSLGSATQFSIPADGKSK
jgi:hypothetical protein